MAGCVSPKDGPCGCGSGPPKLTAVEVHKLRMMQGSGIVDKIYEAAFVPDIWADALGQIAEMSQAAAGSVLAFSDPASAPTFRATEMTRGALQEFVSTDQWKNSARTPLLIEYPAGFCHIADSCHQSGRRGIAFARASIVSSWADRLPHHPDAHYGTRRIHLRATQGRGAV